MSTNELQLVLDAILKLGDAGRDAFIWWLVADKIAPVLGWLGTVVCSCLLIAWAVHRLNPKEPK